MQLSPVAGEPLAGPWRSIAVEDFARELLGEPGSAGSAPTVVAIDGRSGAGKSTLAGRLQAVVPGATLVGTDDLAWHEPMFGWSELAVAGVLEPFRRGRGVHYRPPAWAARARPGHIDVPESSPVLLLEGVGAASRALADLVDVIIWVQSDQHVAEQLGIARDVSSGMNGDRAQSRAFWHAWMEQEIPFFGRERPWERADAVVAGTCSRPTDPRSVVVAAPPSPTGPTR